MAVEFDLAEARVMSELAALDRRLGELIRDRESLQRILLKLRASRVKVVGVTRRNSFSRILVERAVVEFLSRAKKPASTDQLYREASSAVPRLKGNTFRSHLHRMKEQDLIKSESPGRWLLTAEQAIKINATLGGQPEAKTRLFSAG